MSRDAQCCTTNLSSSSMPYEASDWVPVRSIRTQLIDVNRGVKRPWTAGPATAVTCEVIAVSTYDDILQVPPRHHEELIIPVLLA